MRRAVLDSSVLVSAFLTPRRVCGELLDAARAGAFDLWLSAEILSETATVLLRSVKLRGRYRYGEKEVETFCDELELVARMTGSLRIPRVVPNDPNDDMIVATAVAASAGWLVTGDHRHLLALGAHDGIEIVGPRVFLALVDLHSHHE